MLNAPRPKQLIRTPFLLFLAKAQDSKQDGDKSSLMRVAATRNTAAFGRVNERQTDRLASVSRPADPSEQNQSADAKQRKARRLRRGDDVIDRQLLSADEKPGYGAGQRNRVGIG